MKLGLGTVQFGLDYGVANKTGRVPPEEVSKILRYAEKNNIRLLDTAFQYGVAEETLGQFDQEWLNTKLVTKTPSYSSEKIIYKQQAKDLKQAFQKSLQRLNRKACYGLLAHHADDLLKPGGEYLVEAMKELQLSSQVKKIGFSAYDKQQIEEVLSRYSDFDLIQIPLNVLDQRLLADNYLKKLKRNQIEIHARSIFLQGLLLMNTAELPPYFKPILSHLNEYHRKIQEQSLTPLQAALGFVRQVKEVDHFVLGVTSLQHLEQIVEAYRTDFTAEIDFSFAALSDINFINPVKWKLI